MTTFIILLVVLALLATWAAKQYNQLRVRAEAVKRAQSNLVGELRKRATLANQLIDVCKGYGDHEKLTHLTVAASADSAADPMRLATDTKQAITGVSFVAERFPELKANETYRTLMEQLKAIEDTLQLKREALNREAEQYNGYRASFPVVLIASQLGYPEAPYFSTDEAGLEAGASFRTDDGEIIRAQFARIGKGMGDATRQLGSAAGGAIKSAQSGLAQASSRQPTSPAEGHSNDRAHSDQSDPL